MRSRYILLCAMIPIALFLARFVPQPIKPWLVGLSFGRKPERIDPPPMKPTTRVWVAKGYEDKARRDNAR